MWGNRASAALDSYQANLYGVGEAFGSDWAKRKRVENDFQAQAARDWAQSQGAISSYKDINGVGDFFNYAGGLAVDSFPYAGEALVGGLTGGVGLAGTAARMGLSRAAARTAGAVGASYPSAVGDILSNQREQNPGAETNLGSAMLGGVPYAAANAFGIEGALARGTAMRSGIQRLDDLTGFRGAAARTGASVGKGALQEAPSETFQEGVNQYFGRMAVDPNETFFNERSNDRFAESAVGGGVLGGLFGGGMGGWRRSQAWQDRQNAAAQQPLDPRAPADLLQLGYTPDVGGQREVVFNNTPIRMTPEGQGVDMSQPGQLAAYDYFNAGQRGRGGLAGPSAEADWAGWLSNAPFDQRATDGTPMSFRPEWGAPAGTSVVPGVMGIPAAEANVADFYGDNMSGRGYDNRMALPANPYDLVSGSAVPRSEGNAAYTVDNQGFPEQLTNNTPSGVLITDPLGRTAAAPADQAQMLAGEDPGALESRRQIFNAPTTAPAPKDRNWAALGLPAKPTPALQTVYEAAVAARDAGEISPADFKEVRGHMVGGGTTKAKATLKTAISREQGRKDMEAGKAAREAQQALDATALQTQGQPNGALATPGVGAGGRRVAGGAVAQGSVADTGSSAAVGGRVSAAAPGVGVNGAAPAAGANGQAGQSTAVVVDPASADYQETEGIWNDEVEKIQGPAFATLRPETQSYLIQQDSITPAVIQSAAKMEESTRQETAAAANEQGVDQRIAEARIDLPKVLKVLETYPPKMQRAIQLTMGVNEYGNIVDNPISSEEAAKKAGYKDGANIRRTLKALNITQAGVNLLHNPSGAVELDNEARYMGENPNVGDINANVDAQRLGSLTKDKIVASVVAMGERAANPERPFAEATHAMLAKAVARAVPYLGLENRGPDHEIAKLLFKEAEQRQSNKDFVTAFRQAMNGAVKGRNETETSGTANLPAQVTEGEIDEDAGTTSQESDYTNYDASDASDDTTELGSTADENAAAAPAEFRSEDVSRPSAAAGKSPTITVKPRRKFGVAAAEQSDGAPQEAPISVTLNLNGGQTVFADAKKAIRQLDQKIERQKALLGCLRG